MRHFNRRWQQLVDALAQRLGAFRPGGLLDLAEHQRGDGEHGFTVARFAVGIAGTVWKGLGAAGIENDGGGNATLLTEGTLAWRARIEGTVARALMLAEGRGI